MAALEDTGEPAPWPGWFRGFREGQEDACKEVVEAFRAGARVVFLDAPTGAGKTLIAEMVRRELAERCVYVCSSRQLQQQFLADYPYARLLEGRANYPTVDMPWPTYTAEDCTGKGCRWCPSHLVCPYAVAKREALDAELAVLNTAYLLAEANSRGSFGQREDKKTGEKVRLPLVVADECDTLEAALMGLVEVRVGAQLLKGLGLEAPAKGARAATVEAWRERELTPALRTHTQQLEAYARATAELGTEAAAKASKGATTARRLLRQVERVRLAGDEEEGWGDWVRAYDERGAFILKPVVVDRVAPGVLWRHADKWLCMSATVVSAEEQAQSLGLTRARIPWQLVQVPMRFDAARRQVVVRPVADLTHAKRDEEAPRAVEGLRAILAKYPGENVLVHTVSYWLTGVIYGSLCDARELHGRVLRSYGNARERAEAVREFRASGGVLLAPSLERGIDLPDDLCRVIVVLKMPYANLADKAVSARLRRPDGRLWYNAQAARSLVQMTGRGVRHRDDWAVTWVLDKQFGKFYGAGASRLLPRWWRDALVGQPYGVCAGDGGPDNDNDGDK